MFNIFSFLKKLIQLTQDERITLFKSLEEDTLIKILIRMGYSLKNYDTETEEVKERRLNQATSNEYIEQLIAEAERENEEDLSI